MTCRPSWPYGECRVEVMSSRYRRATMKHCGNRGGARLADESAHTATTFRVLAGLYDAVNVELDKAGGLTAPSLSCARRVSEISR